MAHRHASPPPLAERNLLIGPSFSGIDLGLAKWFALGSRAKLQVRAESFNVLNHTSFTGLNTTVRFDAAGNPTSGFGPGA
jgi:hypothetical protein